MSDIVLLAAGERCLKIAENVRKMAIAQGFDFSIVNARFLRPLDEELLNSLSAHYIVTLEDNVLSGGLGEHVLKFYGDSKCVKSFGFPDRFLPHAKVKDLFEEYGLSESEIMSYLKGIVNACG